MLYKHLRHLEVPTSPSLFQSIKSFQQPTDLPFLAWFEYSTRRFHVHSLLEWCIKDNSDSWHLCSRQECLSVINTMYLSVSSCDNPDPVAFYFTIRPSFVFQDFIRRYGLMFRSASSHSFASEPRSASSIDAGSASRLPMSAKSNASRSSALTIAAIHLRHLVCEVEGRHLIDLGWMEMEGSLWCHCRLDLLFSLCFRQY